MRALSERHANKRESFAGSPVNLERETSLELATSTLARWRYSRNFNSLSPLTMTDGDS